MAHAKSLRVIGQSLEVAKLSAFELETEGGNYILSSKSMTKTGEWILRHSLSADDASGQNPRAVEFTPSDIARLNDHAQKQRRSNSRSEYSRLSQLLRALGDHLDRSEVSAFHILWTTDSASVDFLSPAGQIDSRTFTAEKLHQLGSHLRFRRSSGTRFDSN